jgi:hypothetical protein
LVLCIRDLSQPLDIPGNDRLNIFILVCLSNLLISAARAAWRAMYVNLCGFDLVKLMGCVNNYCIESKENVLDFPQSLPFSFFLFSCFFPLLSPPQTVEWDENQSE